MHSRSTDILLCNVSAAESPHSNLYCTGFEWHVTNQLVKLDGPLDLGFPFAGLEDAGSHFHLHLQTSHGYLQVSGVHLNSPDLSPENCRFWITNEKMGFVTDAIIMLDIVRPVDVEQIFPLRIQLGCQGGVLGSSPMTQVSVCESNSDLYRLGL